MESSDMKPAFTFNSFANTSQQRKFLEAFEGFEEEWESKGHESLSASSASQLLAGKPPYPEEWKTEGPTNSFIGPPHFFQFLEFIKDPATTATIEVFLGGIFHAVLHRYRKMFKEHEDESKNVRYPIMLCNSAWFQQEGVLVTVAADIQSSMDYKLAEILTPDGFRRAGVWLQEHGVTHPYLTYYIRNGNLDAKPTLSMRPLENISKALH